MKSFDTIVIGSGPGGYVAAIRASQLGQKTAIVEREALGGVCLNVGCIPSKALITAGHFLHRLAHDAAEMGIQVGPAKIDMKQMQTWKTSVTQRMSKGVEGLLGGNKVEILRGEAKFKSATEIEVKSKDGAEKFTAKNFIIATGSQPIELPQFKFDEKDILSSTGALAMSELPKKVAVIGGGYIGLEITGWLANCGVEVVVLEASSGLLVGLADPECVQVVAKRLKKKNVEIKTSAKAVGYKKNGKKLELSVDVAGKVEKLEVDKILVTVGRRPDAAALDVKAAGVEIDAKGFVKVDAQRRTNKSHIYAIGDIACQPMLAHKASYEGILAAEVIAGHPRAYDVKTVPSVIFVEPEIASAGWTEEECKQNGYTDLMISKFPFAANGRAVSMMETDGFVKMIADKKNHVVLGIHIVGPEASNLISEAVLAIEMGARLEDVALSIHPHPTLGETMMEAAEATLGHAIHIIDRKRH